MMRSTPRFSLKHVIFFAALAVGVVSFSNPFAYAAHAATANSSSVIYLNVGSPPLVPPSIFLNGSNPINLVQGDTFIDPGATATDTENEDLTGSIVVTGGPVNTAIVSTTTLLYSVTDPHNGLSSSISRTVIVSPSSSIVPTQPPAGSSGGGSGPTLYTFNLTVAAGTSTVSIGWLTNLPALSTLAWGTDPDATTGFVSEISASTTHAISLDKLTPDTTYYFIVHEYVLTPGLTGTFSYSFTTLPLVQQTYPSNVSNLTAYPTPSSVPSQGSGLPVTGVKISWTNPTDTDISTIIVTRGTRFFPRDPNEGYLVSDGYETSFIDTDATANGNYFYTVFVKDTHGNYSSGAAVEYVPGMPPIIFPITSTSTGEVSSRPSSSTPPLFGGVVTEISSTTLDKIIFMQKGVKIIPKNGTVAIDAGFPLTISIPAGIIPTATEEAIIKILGSTFVFEKLKNSWLQAIIPAAFDFRTVSPFDISFLFVGAETDLDGIFVLSNTASQVQGIADQVFPNFFPYYFILTVILVIVFARIRRDSKPK